MPMVERNAVVVIAVLFIVLAVLGFVGLIVGGAYEQFVIVMTPGVTLGLALLMLINHGAEARRHQVGRPRAAVLRFERDHARCDCV